MHGRRDEMAMRLVLCMEGDWRWLQGGSGVIYKRGCFLWREGEKWRRGKSGIASSGTDRGFALSVGEKA